MLCPSNFRNETKPPFTVGFGWFFSDMTLTVLSVISQWSPTSVENQAIIRGVAMPCIMVLDDHHPNGFVDSERKRFSIFAVLGSWSSMASVSRPDHHPSPPKIDQILLWSPWTWKVPRSKQSTLSFDEFTWTFRLKSGFYDAKPTVSSEAVSKDFWAPSNRFNICPIPWAPRSNRTHTHCYSDSQTQENFAAKCIDNVKKLAFSRYLRLCPMVAAQTLNN